MSVETQNHRRHPCPASLDTTQRTKETKAKPLNTNSRNKIEHRNRIGIYSLNIGILSVSIFLSISNTTTAARRISRERQLLLVACLLQQWQAWYLPLVSEQAPLVRCLEKRLSTYSTNLDETIEATGRWLSQSTSHLLVAVAEALRRNKTPNRNKNARTV